jgi:hypothetical protein
MTLPDFVFSFTSSMPSRGLLKNYLRIWLVFFPPGCVVVSLDSDAICASSALPVLRGFSRNVKQDSEGSEATGGMRLRRMLPGEKKSCANLHNLFRNSP